MKTLATGTVIAALLAAPADLDAAQPGPNIVFILADDLGHGDLGCYGQAKIRTPRLDRMAKEGMRFTQAYSGASVCAPSRCSLMTGLHTGHAHIRANRELPTEGQIPIPADSFTVAELLKSGGYATACIGKWGLGFVGTTGDPIRQGFDHFFGYNCQRQAHSFYPSHLWRDQAKVPLDGKTYSHDLITADALRWLREHKDQPFFLYLPYTAPHETIAVPDLEPYTRDKPWTPHQKKYASIVTRMDRDIGSILDLLQESGIAGNTLVMFASDNGQDGPDAGFFKSNGDLRGTKRSMYEGGARAPFIAWWPGVIAPGTVSDTPIAFWDILPTAAELAGIALPAEAKPDGVSLAGLLRGGPAPQREYLYWELHEGRFIQALRKDRWKIARHGASAPYELYDLAADPCEKSDLAARNPEQLAALRKLIEAARTDSALWPVKDKTQNGGRRGPGKKKT